MLHPSYNHFTTERICAPLCQQVRIIDGASHRHSFCSYYCLYGKSIFQLRFISWGINVFLCPGVHADGQQGK